MAMRVGRVVVFVGSTTAVVSVIGQASAARLSATPIKCSWKAHIKGGTYHYKGVLVGSAVCGHHLGRGRYHERYRDNITMPTAASESGSVKIRFKTGSVHGSYTIPPSTIAGHARYHGTLHITGGTGQFSHVSGTLHMSCTHAVPATGDCRASGTVTGI